ncbi:hypothetical protein UT300005_02260 [Clostridium sp. CTA-5]
MHCKNQYKINSYLSTSNFNKNLHYLLYTIFTYKNSLRQVISMSKAKIYLFIVLFF